MTARGGEWRYILELVATAAGTGSFAPLPENRPNLETALQRLRACPRDSFLHRYVLQMLAALDPARQSAMRSATRGADLVFKALWAELSLLEEDPAHPTHAEESQIRPLAAASPSILLRHALLADRGSHARWAALMAANLEFHRPLPGIEDPQRPLLPERGCAAADAGVGLEAVSLNPRLCAAPPVPLAETIRTASTRLARAGILVSGEMRHEASLSPVGLLHQWRFQRRVRSGGLDYRLGGFQTAYGRGFGLETARAAYLMEIVERFSAYGEFAPREVLGHRCATPLHQAPFSRMQADGRPALDPNDLMLEVPYQDEPLFWRPAEAVGPGGRTEIWVPAQCVYLFCNLDEPDLFSGLGSTGLGAGNTMTQARLAALLEVVERDAEALTPFSPGDCFAAQSTDPWLQSLLTHYDRCGIQVQFQDLTGPLGVPCYKCFVVGPDGRIAKGTGAHPEGRRALLSALTETMYPYPNGPVSGPGLPALPVRPIEALPDHGSGSMEADLDRMERLLRANGFRLLYVDLTRRDLDLPVVRAIVPGLSPMADYDRFARINPRLIRRLEGLQRAHNG